MLAIRLARVGKRNKAQFKITLQEKTVAPGGRHVEILGSYDPHSKQVVLKEDRIKYWISKGAKVSDTVNNILVGKQVISGEKIKVKVPKKKVEEVREEAKPEDEVLKEEAKKEEKIEEKKEEVKPEKEDKK